MRFVLLVVALSLCLALAFAESCSDSVKKYLDAGEGYSTLGISAGGQFLLFSINEKYSMLARCEQQNSTYLSNAKEIEAVLNAYANQSENSLSLGEQWKNRMEEYLNSFSGSRAKEAECKRNTGTDRFPCSDRKSCFQSCYTPLCEVKYGEGCELSGNGCSFIDGIVEFSKTVTSMDSAESRLKTMISDISIMKGQAKLGEAVSAVETLLSSADAVNNNVLLRTPQERGYYFCPKVSYDKGSLEAMKEEFVDVKNRYWLLTQTNETALTISIESKRRIELRANLDACAEYLNYSGNAILGIEGTNRPTINYSEVKDAVARMRAVDSELKSLCSDRRFSEASNSIGRFRGEETTARSVLTNTSAEYDSVNSLYLGLLAEMSANPPRENASALNESMRIVGRELSAVNNMSDLMILKGVLLENQKELERQNGRNGTLKQVEPYAIPLLIAVIVAIALYFVMKKSKRRGL